jgi:flagellin
MGLYINTNTSSLIAADNLNTNQTNLEKSLQQLSSGLQINSAADNPAGLVISQQMLAQITGLNQAASNSQNAVSMTQTAEGALDEVNTLLDTARQLTLDASNTGVNDIAQSQADQAELDNVISSITRISQVTQFGTKNLLDGSLNGASNLSSDITRVNVGNLANNPAISDGTMTLNVTAGSDGKIALAGVGTNSYIFSGAVTGVTLGSKNVVSGVSVTLNVNNQVVSYITSGALGATALAGKLNTLATAYGFGVTANAAGQMVVTRNTIGSSPFTSQLSFSRGGTSSNVVGTSYVDTDTIKATAPSVGSGSAAAIFTNAEGGKLSGVSASTIIQGTGIRFTLTVKASGATSGHTISVSGTAGETVGQALAALQTRLNLITGAFGFSGASIQMLAGVTSGMKFSVTQATTDSKQFSFSLNVDKQSNPIAKSSVQIISLTGAAVFKTGAIATQATWITNGSGNAGNKFSGGGANTLASGAALEVTVSGHTIILTGKRTTTQLAAAIQTALSGLGGGFIGIHVAFVTGGATLQSSLGGEVGLTAGATISGVGFAFNNHNGAPLTVTLKVDQKSGFDVTYNTPYKSIAGSQPSAALDLGTVAASSALFSGPHSGATVSSTSGASTVTLGTNALAVLTSSNGVTLNLVSTNVTSTGGATLTLTTGSQSKGYNGAAIEIKSTLATNGGLANFTLNQGAVFQVGANAGQTVGLTIQSTASTELGRNASSTLTSLDDLSSSKASALTTGQTTAALNVIDAAINQVTNLRGQLGAFQADTLQSGLNSLQVATQNLTSAQGTIVDVDFAAASANFSKNQILVQSSTAMLAQANQLPQNVLKLLQ